jgi:CRISPR-associated endonuclease/helicase Cas3
MYLCREQGEYMDTETSVLSSSARILWGKLSHDGFQNWLPLWVHLCDTSEVAKLLWDHWLPEHTKRMIANGISDALVQDDDRLVYARKIAVFMAAAHDIGKGSPAFQEKAAKVGFSDVVDEITSRGLAISSSTNEVQKRDFTHAIIAQAILELQGLDRSYAVVVGGHHGKPPNNGADVDRVTAFPSITGVGKIGWNDVQNEFVQFALDKAGLICLPKGQIAVTAQVLLTGFLIMADWIASGDSFPLVSRDYSYRSVGSSKQRAHTAWTQLHLPELCSFSEDCPWESLYSVRFGIDMPRPVQISSLQAALAADQPGIFVIEAPMGEGKTEAALAVAEVLARKYKTSGVYFALPTQATSDGIFKRIENWIGKLHPKESKSIFLAHGKAGFNKDYEGIKIHSNICTYEEIKQSKKNCREAVIVNDWTQGRKKGLLSDFVVGTIDQILMCGLKQKHLALRHLGVVNKVVIIDECHAYDTYMSSYLDLVLSWLGAYHIPVIVLSATLPPHRRKELLKAYGEAWPHKKKKKTMLAALRSQTGNTKKTAAESLQMNSSYPLISYTEGCEIKEIAPSNSGRKLTVKIEFIDEMRFVEMLQSLLVDGGCAGIIRNTVQKAQETARMLEACFGAEHVRLLHSRFISCDRVRKEEEIRSLLGPGEKQRPQKLIVVGTQVMEQSLDVDFDVLFTDICPMDLLLQRMGRLHRHARHQPRPFNLRESACFVMGIETETEFDKGSTAVYGAYLLLKTKAFLKKAIQMPVDIPKLVQQSYEEGYDAEMVTRLSNTCDSNVVQAVCTQAKKEYTRIISDKKSRAETFQIMKPKAKGKDLVAWLQADLKDKSGKRGEATVRDVESSLEVLVVVKKNDGSIYTLPWLSEYANTAIVGVPADNLAKAIAGCSVSLPTHFTATWNIDRVITELETVAMEHHLDDWYESYWLEGELFLVLNEKYEMILLDKIVTYDEKYGLSVK